MPILKNVPTEFDGVDAGYHEIVSIRDNLNVPEVSIFVHSYADVDSRGGKPLRTKTYIFNNVPVDLGLDEEGNEQDPVIPYPYFLTEENLAPAGATHLKLCEQNLLTHTDFQGGTIV